MMFSLKFDLYFFTAYISFDIKQIIIWYITSTNILVCCRCYQGCKKHKLCIIKPLTKRYVQMQLGVIPNS